MSGLFGSKTTIANAETPLSGLQIQSSAYGLAMAFGYGRTRVAPNLIWYGDFTAVPHTSSQSSGGKGGGGVTSTSTTYTYTASFALAMGETVTAINQVWIDKATAEDVNIKFSTFNGPDPQTAWSYLTGAHPTEALGYSGLAYVAVAGYDLGARTILPNHTFDVTLKLPLGGGVDDADPGQILPDLLTNPQYGVTNFPSARIGDMSRYSTYCRAAGLLLSPLYDQPQAASQIITNLMQITNSGVFFSEGVLKVTPYGDASLNNHGASFTPDLSSKADFGEDDFLVGGSEDPVRVKRNAIPETVSGSADAYNQVTLEILDRSQDYRAVPIVAQDMVSIDAIGLRPMATITAHEIADAAVGQAVANLILQRVLNIRATYEWSAGWQWCRLEPTDIVSLTEDALGMDGYPVRILMIDEDSDTGGLKFTAEDVPFGIGHHVAAPLPVLGGYAADQAIAPGPTNAPVIFEPPNSLTAPDLQLWVAASGGVNWGGCEVWASDDGTSYRRVGVITNPARHGTLTALLSAGSDPDTTHALHVELAACHGQLLPGTTADADAHNTLLWVDGELLAYSSATLTGSYAYTLDGYLRRGIKGTANATHASAAKFAHIDDALFRYTMATDRIGSSIWLKFPAFNTQGFALQPLSDVTAYQHTLTGNKPLQLTSLSATGGMFQVSLVWGLPAGQVDLDYTEIWGATSNNRAAAFLLTSAKHPTAAWAHPGLQPGQTWYYWARAVDTSGNNSDWYPSNSTAGVAAAPSADPTDLLTQLKNAVGISELASDLAAPITLMPGAERSNALTSLQNALSDWDITNRMQFQEAVTDAIVRRDPLTGQIQLLATANVTTEVESRLTAVEVAADAVHGTLTSTVATVSTIGGNLSATQSQVTLLAGQVAMSASTVYVDSSVANASGALTVEAANAASALAQAEIQTALDAFTQGGSLRAMNSNVATAQEQIKTTGDALASEVVSRSALVVTTEANGAAILEEARLRSTTVDAVAGRTLALETRVNDPATGLTNKASIAYVDQAKSDARSASASSESVLFAAFGTGANRTVRQGTAPTQSTITSTLSDGTTRSRKYFQTGDIWYSTVTAPETVYVWTTPTPDTDGGSAGWAQTQVNTPASWNTHYGTTRSDATSALAVELDGIATRFTGISGAFASYISNYTYSKSDADTAISNGFTSYNTSLQAPGGALYTTNANVTDINIAKIGYATLNSDGSTFDNSGAIVDKAGVTAWNAAHPTNTATWNVGLPLAQAIKQVSIVTSAGTAKLQDTFTAQALTNSGLLAQRVLRVDTAGRVAGIQLASGLGGSSIVALADKFVWVMETAPGSGMYTASKKAMILGFVNGVATLGLDGNLVIDGSVLARSINGTGLTIANGSSPALGGGGTMTGAGALLNSSGTFAIGNPSKNINFDGAVFTINGEVVVNGNIVNNSATNVTHWEQWLVNNTAGSYGMTMDHSGTVTVILTYQFTASTVAGTFTTSCDIDNSTRWLWSVNGTYDGTVNMQMSAYNVPAGSHTLYFKANHSAASGSHLVLMTIFRTYK